MVNFFSSTKVDITTTWKNGHHLHNKLMGSGDQGKTVGMVESFGDVLSKSVSSTSGRDSPATTVIRI